MTALTLLVIVGCAARPAHVRPAGEQVRRIANLERAAVYPWLDDGACVVQEASGEWSVLVERCFHALDLSRIQFRDLDQRCPVAQVSAAALGPMVGICLMVQPQLVVGAIVVIGVVVVASAIAAELKKLPCDCICFGIDGLGKRHGPYPIGRKRNSLMCHEDCLQQGYDGGGRCRQ